MCYQAQKHVALGYCSMLQKCGDFQYSYRLFLEESDGKEVVIDQPFSLLTQPITTNFYRELVRQHPKAAACCELYTLYLGMVSVNMVANYERKLIQLLRSMTSPKT